MAMVNLTRASVMAASLALAGCNGGPAPAGPAQADCGAAQLQQRIGAVVTGRTAADLRVDGALVSSRGDVRVIGPDDSYTEDYREARLNLFLSPDGTLERATCG